MKPSNYLHVATFGKPHGVKGELKLKLQRPLKDARKIPGHFFVKEGASYLPYFIERLEPTVKDMAIIKIEDADSKEQASQLVRKEAFVELKTVDQFFGMDQEETEDYLMQFTVSNEDGSLVGEVVDVLETAAYPVLTVRFLDQEIMVPMPDELIIELDEQNRRLVMELPQGLFDL